MKLEYLFSLFLLASGFGWLEGFFLPPTLLTAGGGGSSAKSGFACPPTEPDMLGPMYQPNAPVRSRVGEGYILSGQVKSAADCSPIANARIEFWLANPKGRYDDDHRATMFSEKNGGYRFESNFPPSYSFRAPHIHVKVTAAGYQTLVTQHYPAKGAKQATFDLVLIPAK
jgi:protocatechuate 3,4-dioxygenase beta subunit